MFRFENVDQRGGVQGLVKALVGTYNFQWYEQFHIGRKLKALKAILQRWNKEDFGKAEKRKKAVLKKLADWGVLEVQRPLNQVEVEMKFGDLEDFKNGSFFRRLFGDKDLESLT